MVNTNEEIEEFEANFSEYHIDRLNDAFDIFNSIELRDYISDEELRNIYLDEYEIDIKRLKIRILRQFHACCSRYVKQYNEKKGGKQKRKKTNKKRKRKQTKKIKQSKKIK